MSFRTYRNLDKWKIQREEKHRLHLYKVIHRRSYVITDFIETNFFAIRLTNVLEVRIKKAQTIKI